MSSMITALGRLFISGFKGETPPDEFLEFAKEAMLGGVIFFADNCANPALLSESIRTIKELYNERSPFMAIDQEGGRVCRLKGAPAEFRSAAEYGRNTSLERYVEDYTRSTVYMESLGLNLNFAPVTDIFISPDNSCLKGRCFGDKPGQVALFVKATVRTARDNGLLSCLKHFPGLGAATNDPHLETAVAEYDLPMWHSREKIPFEDGIAAGADMIMTTHLAVPKMDKVIVTGSEKIITDHIRGDLGFDGPVITDDLTMQGAAVLGDIGTRTVAAFNAGHDLLLFGQDFRAAREAYEALVDAFRRGEIPEHRINAALDRVSGVQCTLPRSVIR
jgi:beta-N-acetylhexosaminidase